MLDTPFNFTRSGAVKLTVALVLATLAVSVAIGVATGIAKAVWNATPAWLSGLDPTVLSLGNILAFGVVLAGTLRRTHTPWREFLLFRPAAVRVYALLLLAMIGMSIIASDIDNLIGMIVPPPALLLDLFGGLSDLALHPIAAPFALVVMAPVTEELFFRGLILRRLLASVPPWQAIWVSALLFMALHLNPWQFPIALLTGLLFGWLYARTRSLALCLAGHAFINALSLLISGLPFTIRGFNTPPATGEVFSQPWWFDLLGAAALATAIYFISRTTPPLPPPPVRPEPPLLGAEISPLSVAAPASELPRA